MKSHTPALAIAAIALLCSLGANDALAKKDKNQGNHGQNYSQGHNDAGDKDIIWKDVGGTGITLRIGSGDRNEIKSYIKNKHAKKCPPGLAKKNNGCLPPGIAKKYHVGQRLSNDVSLANLPSELLKILDPAPKGYRYGQVDNDVLLISEATRKVVDAVSLISALNN